MPSSWTEDQILALAPDAGSVKSGKELATPHKWVTLGVNDSAAWGECQGSSKTPYQTQIDLSEPAFKCSCPSRKFPCKHGLGLFLLLARQHGAFTQSDPPSWVTDWLEGRAKRAEQAAVRKEQKAEKVVDEKAQAKRAADRGSKVTAGLEELGVWLGDLIRHGLAAPQHQDYSFWDKTAARMVDAQCPGIARMIRNLAGIPSSGEGWESRLLTRLSRIYLLTEGYKRIDTLPPEVQADIRSVIGWTQSQEELLNQPGVRDIWQVLGQRTYEEDRLKVQRTWLCGTTANRGALILQFAQGSQPLDMSLVAGTVLDATLVFYPGAYPIRAIIKERHAPTAPVDRIKGCGTLKEGLQAYGEILARNPWIEDFPLALNAVTPVRDGEMWMLVDSAGDALPLSPAFAQSWELMAISGGRPVDCFGEWDGERLSPLSAWADGRFIDLTRLGGEG